MKPCVANPTHSRQIHLPRKWVIRTYECRQRGIEPQTYDNVEELQAEIDMLAKDLA